MMVSPGRRDILLPSSVNDASGVAVLVSSFGLQVRAFVVAAGHRRARCESAVEVEGRLEVQRFQALLVGRGTSPSCRTTGLQAVWPRPQWPPCASAVQLEHLVHVVGRAVAGRELVHALRERGADAARRAEAAALVAKKCAKLRATSNMSREREHHEGAGRGTSSKAMRRSNSRPEMHTPDGPPTCTAACRARRSPRGPAHRDAEGVLVDARPLAVAGHRMELAARGLRRADAGEPGAAVQRDQRRGQKVSTLFTTVGWPR
jgi:hypothetical protein